MKISFNTRLEESGPNKRQRAARRAAKLAQSVEKRIAHELSPAEITRKREAETAGLKMLPHKIKGREGYKRAGGAVPNKEGMPPAEMTKSVNKATARHQANPAVDVAQKKIMGTASLGAALVGASAPIKKLYPKGSKEASTPREPEIVLHRKGEETVIKGVLGDLASKPKAIPAPDTETLPDTHTAPKEEKPAGSFPKLSAKTTLPKVKRETEQEKFDREKAEVLARDPEAFKKGVFAPEKPKPFVPRRQSPAPARPENPEFWDKPL